MMSKKQRQNILLYKLRSNRREEFSKYLKDDKKNQKVFNKYRNRDGRYL
jgi:hypothetical protein|tara:strand:+ start:635 stop:781 length:147 start_codon:yes stop_codon:yes gene_type:complete